MDMNEMAERIENLEKATFGFTRVEAKQYLDDAEFKRRTMTPEKYDEWCSFNLKTVERAEHCLGKG